MKNRKIIYKDLNNADCFFEYEGRNIKKSLIFLKAEDVIYIGLQTFCDDNRFEIKKNDSLYESFLPLFKENRILRVKTLLYEIKIFLKDEKIIFRFDSNYAITCFPMEITDPEIINKILEVLNNIKEENNIEEKKQLKGLRLRFLS